ncbi:CidA/LrgA family protein [Paracoccus jiaweipingae]|uniref:CidA/LrgA family protein n=1 Tax=unclassified Paracoccus (in: a-proteobacteria) TaxID=2688777 RepID=UPI0037B45794
MVPALVIILFFQLAGEVTSRGLGLPVPGPVIGLLLLVAGCAMRPALAERLRPVVQMLLSHLSLFFVPAGVGVVAQFGVLRENGLALGVAIMVSTVAAIVAGALAFSAVARLTKGGEDE